MTNLLSKKVIIMSATLGLLFSPIMRLESSCQVINRAEWNDIQKSNHENKQKWIQDQTEILVYARENNVPIQFKDADGRAISLIDDSNQNGIVKMERSGEEFYSVATIETPETKYSVLVKLKASVNPNDRELSKLIDQTDGSSLKPIFTKQGNAPAESPVWQWFRTQYNTKTEAKAGIKRLKRSPFVEIVEHEKMLPLIRY